MPDSLIQPLHRGHWVQHRGRIGGVSRGLLDDRPDALNSGQTGRLQLVFGALLTVGLAVS